REAAAEPRGRQPLAKALDVAVDDRLYIGRQRRRRGALEFTKLPRDVGGDGDIEIGQGFDQQRAQRPFVRRVYVGIEEADGDRLVAAGVQRRQQPLAHVGNIERRLDGAVGKDAFRNLEGSDAGHHRRGVLGFEIIDARTTMALQSQDIAKTLGGDECRRKALALQYRVGGNGRPVREVLDRGDVDAAGEQGVEGTLVRCARYAWYLGHADALGANG